MAGETLFEAAEAAAVASAAPLAVRMRPRTLDEVVGQRHLLAAGAPLRRLIEGGGAASLLLWGPPGSGKTTLAQLVAGAAGRRFVELSAVSAGVREVRAVIDEARRELAAAGRGTVLFVDEVHRFSRTQQDALLPAVEARVVTLVAATTENPSFAVVGPLLSRSLLCTLAALTEEEIRVVLARATADPRGLGGRVRLGPAAVEHLVRLAGGDARRALTALEAAADAVLAAAGSAGGGERPAGPGRPPPEVDLAAVERAVDRAAVRYDRTGDQHYDVASALIKSIRGSDVDAALHYLARMVEAGEDPRFVARRLVVLASEDVGEADPAALPLAVAAAAAVERVGLPEARLNLAQAVIHLALAPKSNAVIAAYEAAAADVRAGRVGPVPAHLRDAHYAGAGRLGHGAGYRYPHDEPAGVLAQRYAPAPVEGREYYRPSPHGAEAAAGRRLAELRRTLRGGRSGGPYDAAAEPRSRRPVPTTVEE